MAIDFQYNDGGRKAAGYKGTAGDCVCRAISIASELPYAEVYTRLADGNGSQRRSKNDRGRRVRSAAGGIDTTRKWFKDYMAEIGFKWVPCMTIGSGCKVHVAKDELPTGRLVLSLSKHYAAVIDGVLNDTYDCSRDGTRCVYGYYIMEGV